MIKLWTPQFRFNLRKYVNKIFEKIIVCLVFTETVVLCFSTSVQAENNNIFRFHLFSEPASITPSHFEGTDSNYFYTNLFKGLFTYDDVQGLVPEGAISCARPSSLKLECKLNPKTHWSDGSPVLPQDYIQAFRQIVNPESKCREAGLLFSLKNARSIVAGSAPISSLGISSPSKFKLLFEFDKPDFDFEYKLTSPVLTPWRVEPKMANWSSTLSNGPYLLTEWQKGRRLVLKSNPHYWKKGERPDVEILFVAEDNTALSLFESGTLSLLRRLPSVHIPSFREKSNFFQTPFARFDYIGFGPELKANPLLRKALSLGVDYEEFRRIFFALGRPGCPGIPDNFLDRARCLNFNITAARLALSQVPEDMKPKKFYLYYSKTGGDDIRRVAEWYQGQWKKNLGLNVELETRDQGVYLSELKTSPPMMFRKGVSLDRPTCLAAVESFMTGHPENYIQYSSKKFDAAIAKLRVTKQQNSRRLICGELIQILLDENLIIPQGRIHFSMLKDSRFSGWKVNELNQLDLTMLRFNKAQSQ